MPRQTTFADLDYARKKRQTRQEIFLSEMEAVVPWVALLQRIEPYYPERGRRGLLHAAGEHVAHLLHAELVQSVRPADGRCPV